VEENLLQALHAGEMQDDGSQQNGGIYTDIYHALSRLAQGCFAIVIEHPGTGDLHTLCMQLQQDSAAVSKFSGRFAIHHRFAYILQTKKAIQNTHP
jgi:hypothetical protein